MQKIPFWGNHTGKIALYIMLLSCIFGHILTAQKAPDIIPDEFLVQIPKNTAQYTDNELVARLNSYLKNTGILVKNSEIIAPEMGIFRIEIAPSQIPPQNALATLRNCPILHTVQHNHLLKIRATIPNDPNFAQQTQHINTGANGGVANMDLDSDLAWDISTGGLSALGDTIVVAVIDDGINHLHPDLAANMYVNWAEIPNNGIDDDQNGYIDDRLGWNIRDQNDNIFQNGGGIHGTPVSGIIGAVGNNGIGVAGVNWKVKIMMIRKPGSITEANVLAAYNYALTQRKLYNQTNGQKGAFVVATNASFGSDFGRPQDAPLWCAMYDSLGKHGILSVGAAPNNDIDVDSQGDLPTTCPSEFLIAVTNLDQRGEKVANAGYGQRSIDIGAFGEGAFTTNLNSGYSAFGGTSAATPQVTGAIALAISSLCATDIHLYKSQPAAIAHKVKRAILENARFNVYLDGFVSSNGQLNLYHPLLSLQNACASGKCFAPYALHVDSLSPSAIGISWVNFDNSIGTFVQLETAQGQILEQIALTANRQTYFFQNLSPCTNYRIVLSAACANGTSDTSVWVVQTDACCAPPQNIELLDIQTNTAIFSHTQVAAAQAYRIFYKPQAQIFWDSVQTNSLDSFHLNSLQACTYYAVRIASLCDSNLRSEYSDTVFFYTLGCADCTILPYCTSRSNNSTGEFIQSLSIDNQIVTSGNNNGYGLFSNPIFQLQIGQTHQLTLTQSAPNIEYLRVWVDWNQNGSFEDAGEKLAQALTPFQTNIPLAISLPSLARAGITRMRVALKYGAYPETCDTFAYGEVEDYCVRIVPAVGVTHLSPTFLPAAYFSASSQSLFLPESPIQKVIIFNQLGQLIHTFDEPNSAVLSLDFLDMNQLYYAQLWAKNGQVGLVKIGI